MKLGHPLCFSFSVECVSWSVGRIEKKKNKLKQNHKKSPKRRPWYPRMTLRVNIYIIWIKNIYILNAQYTVKNVSVFVPVFLYAVTTSLLFFFFENAKNLGRSDYAKRRKKRGWP